MFGCTGSLLLHGGFLYCIERGLLFILGHGLRVAMASLVAECRLWGAGHCSCGSAAYLLAGRFLTNGPPGKSLLKRIFNI